ncbi:hypothetical protein [Thauera chlorobenzoica]|uniref:hypothetical protein n=1 Tax=Thauera chlorobenzoica TaxID=96773 RepID=UPI0008A0080E|nr:hypothetical protein [Thauera chlorobenzoica]SEG17501.1 hypothetical protein SAMN05216242_12240 [Thauera chlorobenzoica]
MIRKDNAPQNLSLLKKAVLNLIRADKTDPGNPMFVSAPSPAGLEKSSRHSKFIHKVPNFGR